MDTVARTAEKVAKSLPPTPADEAVDIYVWKPAVKPLHARPSKRPPSGDPLPSSPVVPVSAPPSWARVWRIFLAGAIMGVAVTKAAELLLKGDHKD